MQKHSTQRHIVLSEGESQTTNPIVTHHSLVGCSCNGSGKMNQTAHIPIQECWQILSLIRLVWKLDTSDLHLFRASANVDEGQ